jgi:hypothetical protein
MGDEIKGWEMKFDHRPTYRPCGKKLGSKPLTVAAVILKPMLPSTLERVERNDEMDVEA